MLNWFPCAAPHDKLVSENIWSCASMLLLNKARNEPDAPKQTLTLRDAHVRRCTFGQLQVLSRVVGRSGPSSQTKLNEVVHSVDEFFEEPDKEGLSVTLIAAHIHIVRRFAPVGPTSCDASHQWKRQQLRWLFLRPATLPRVGEHKLAVCAVPVSKWVVRARHARRLSPCGLFDSCCDVRHVRCFSSPCAPSDHPAAQHAMCVASVPTRAGSVSNALRAARTPGRGRDGAQGCGGERGAGTNRLCRSALRGPTPPSATERATLISLCPPRIQGHHNPPGRTPVP